MSHAEPIPTTPFSIALAGPACSGKSTAARELAERLNLELVTARNAIEVSVGLSHLTRRQLVDHGASLERERPGEWLLKAFSGIARDTQLVIDSARTRAQLAALDRWRPRLLTVFLMAPIELRRQRYRARAALGDMDFDELSATIIELEAQGLGPACGLMLDSAKLSSAEIVEMVYTIVHPTTDRSAQCQRPHP